MSDDIKQIKADNPVSITDGAPRTVNVNGAECRIPSAMDYRIVARCQDAGVLDDEFDQACLMLYCALHTSRKQIGQLWELARKPKALAEKLLIWQASQTATNLAETVNALMEYDQELGAEASFDSGEHGESDAKKKTG